MKLLNWNSHIKEIDKKEVISYLDSIEQGKEIPENVGSLSSVFIGKKYVVKSNIDFDVFDNLFDITIELNNDGDILHDLYHLKYYPILYAHNSDFVVMELIKGKTVEEYYIKNGILPLGFKQQLRIILLSVIDSGWVPYDIRLSDIFINNHEISKIIDVNLYQRKELYQDILNSMGNEKFVDKVIDNMIYHEQRYLNDYRKYSNR